MSVEVRAVRDDGELRAAMALREAVFMGEQGVPRELERDGRDAQAAHLVALDDGTVVGTARLLADGDVVRLGRLAVAPTARRRGIARRLLEHAEGWARERGSRAVVLSAQTGARALYDAAGYRASGPTYTEAGIEHIRMERDLA